MAHNRVIYNWFLNHITLHTYDDQQAELLNGLTHLMSAGMSLVAFAAIVIRVVPKGDTAMSVAGIVFGMTMILLYFSSSMYHLVDGPVIKRVMRLLDHITIYILIAGTYTPVTVYIDTPAAHTVLVIAWGLTLAGTFFTIFFWGRYGALHVLFYIGMGWMIVVIWDGIRSVLPAEFLYWALAGGLTYTLGTVVYAAKRVPFYHAIWHLFVTGGSACFFIGIYLYLL